MKKTYESFENAVADIRDGARIFVGNFAGPGGTPFYLIQALRNLGVKDLTIIANTAGGIGLTLDYPDHSILFESHQVRKVIASFPFSTSAAKVSAAEKQIISGEVELELVPQGTLAERIRASGAGITAFYTPTGPGTIAEEGKEKRYFEGKPHLLEYALRADYALVRAYKADELGNLVFRGTQRQFNPIMATAAEITIAEVDDIVKPGELDPDNIVVPSVYVKRLVKIVRDPGFPRHINRNFQVKGNIIG